MLKKLKVHLCMQLCWPHTKKRHYCFQRGFCLLCVIALNSCYHEPHCFILLMQKNIFLHLVIQVNFARLVVNLHWPGHSSNIKSTCCSYVPRLICLCIFSVKGLICRFLKKQHIDSNKTIPPNHHKIPFTRVGVSVSAETLTVFILSVFCLLGDIWVIPCVAPSQ